MRGPLGADEAQAASSVLRATAKASLAVGKDLFKAMLGNSPSLLGVIS